MGSYGRARTDLALDALGDPTRRRLVDLLREGESTVGRLAGRLPVSRPAVSRHLRILREAGLVEVREEGTRRWYRLALGGFADLRDHWERIWAEASRAFETAAEGEGAMRVVRQSVEVDRTVEEAFRLFTEGIGRWWPLRSHSLSGEQAVDARMEPREGGRVFEVAADGSTFDWGVVLAWEPPRRVRVCWKPNVRDEPYTIWEARLTGVDGPATRLDLEHWGWEALGAPGGARAGEYGPGWTFVLGRFAAAAGGG
jgi:DNA-binding transcriptional ArsR family regulator